jgi:hypothetical protein
MEVLDRLPRRQPLKPRNHYLDDEAAGRREVRRDVAEAPDLRLLRGQVHDRVRDEVRERERALDRGSREVADRDTDVFATPDTFRRKVPS